MKLSVFGLGYVGTVCSVCLADNGHQVIGVDKSESKVSLVQSGNSPIVERGIDDLVRRNAASGRLTATLNANDAVASTDISIICVGTPSRGDGSPDLTSIETVLAELGHAISAKTTRHCVVVRSTVVPGTMRGVIMPRLAETCGKAPFRLAFNPEFLREGSAVADFNQPARTIVGASDEETAATVMSLYETLPGAKIATDFETAELVKYVDNAWHALKVTFANEVGVLAKTLSINTREVMDIFFKDTNLNISTAYLRPGFAFGGSCLPKDLRALTYLCEKFDLSLPVINHVLDSNQMLIERGVDWILEQSKSRVAFLGISFKRGTDDVRESPFVEMIGRLIRKGRSIRIFDPNVKMDRLLGANKDYLIQILPQIAELMAEGIVDAVSWADTIVVTTTDPAYAKAIACARSDQIVLDFTDLNINSGGDAKVTGFLW
jgi:GDP-mannose 6-dehydrogenase